MSKCESLSIKRGKGDIRVMTGALRCMQLGIAYQHMMLCAFDDVAVAIIISSLSLM